MKKKEAIELYNKLLKDDHKYWKSKSGEVLMVPDPSRIRIIYDDSDNDYGLLYTVVVIEKDLGSGAIYVGFETIAEYDYENVMEDFYTMMTEQKFRNEFDRVCSELYDIVYGAK